MSYNTTIVPAQKAAAMLDQALDDLLEQQTLLEHLAIEQFRANEILYHSIKCLNSSLRFKVHQARLHAHHIADF